MVPVWLKALLFVGGGAAAAAGAAYVTGVLDPWLGRQPQVIAALPETPSSQSPQQEPPAASEDVPLPDDPETAGKQPRLTAPDFDVVRVEPDGSLLVAGTASPEAGIELLHDDRVLGKTKAGAGGDFVIVLDDRLAAGDYALSLRATAADGSVVASTQTAIVSIPERDDGQVLVMVEEPGAPATLLSVPEGPADAGAQEETSAPEQEVAAAPEPEATPQEEVAAAPEAEASPGSAASKEQAVGEDVAAAPEASDEPETAVEEAAAPAEPEQQPAATGNVVVEAVEIEGDTIFVAGYADAGRTVRVYADDLLLGDARASEAGRFLVEARRELPVGSYLIRADLLSDDGTVLARAAVPFEREPGEAIAAVAVPPAPEAVAGAAPKPDAVEEGEAQPPAQEETVTAAPETAAAGEEPAAAEAAPEAQESDAGQEVAAATEESEAAPEGDATSAPANEEQVAAAPEEPEATSEEEAASAPADEEQIAAAPAAVEAQPEATAPPLQRVDGAVIIRRGDTLWRISRRVYGHGVRYSTIYLANQDQIRDPNRIWPGQVFNVPQATPEGEEADMGAVAEQVITPEGQGAAAQ